MTNHGTAVPIAGSRGVAATVDASGTPRILVWPRDHKGTGSILAIDAAAGAAKQIATPDGKHQSSPFAILLSDQNNFYAQFNGSFYAFDADELVFSFWAAVESRFAMSLTEGPNGTIWSAGYPESRLYAFDPETEELTRYGSINQENWAQYPRSLAVGAEGWVYVGIGTTAGQIIAFNPDNEERRPIIAEEDRVHGMAEVFRGTNGKVYGQAPEASFWYELSNGTARRVDEPPVDPVPIKKGSQSAVYREFPDGRYLETFDLTARYAEIRQPNSNRIERIEFDYETEGAVVHAVIGGPDGKVYGSTGLPLRFFTWDPGAAIYSYERLPGGQVNTFAVRGDTILLAVYPGGVLYEYDPEAPWKPGATTSSNPRRVFDSKPAITRPHAVLAPAESPYVIFGGTPDYGITGGGMVVYEPATGDTALYRDEALLTNHSVRSLARAGDGSILVGTTIAPGTGGETIAEEAHLYGFDPEAGQILFDLVPVPEAEQIQGLKRGPDGLVYGFAAPSTFFVFDPEAREIVHTEVLDKYGSVAGLQGSRVFTVGTDGMLYALFRDAIVQIEPGTFSHRAVVDPPVDIHAGLGVTDGRLYFSHGSSMWSFDLP